MNNYYEINQGTMCLIQKDKSNTKVYEVNNEYIINRNVNNIIDESCKNFGSTLKGRIDGTSKLTGIRYKAPIVISEYLSIIMIPTSSTRSKICNWINLNYIKKIIKTNDNKCAINFINGKTIKFNISYFIMQNQITKATRLDYYLRKNYK